MITVISSSTNNYKEAIEKAVDYPEIIQCFSTTGWVIIIMGINNEFSVA